MGARATVGDWRLGDVPVVFEDEDLIVIDKPAGLVVHPAPGVDEATLAELFADRIGGGDETERKGIVHRLDRGTSGLMLLARNGRAHAELQRAIQEREVERTYLALVQGAPRTRAGKIDAPIGRSPRERHRMAVDGAGSREAVTHFRVVETLDRSSLVEVKLETGRTHQIRVHMASIGNPVVGDPTYGGELLFGLDRPFLHSARLVFRHPSTGRSMEFEAPFPEELVRALEIARGDPPGNTG